MPDHTDAYAETQRHLEERAMNQQPAPEAGTPSEDVFLSGNEIAGILLRSNGGPDPVRRIYDYVDRTAQLAGTKAYASGYKQAQAEAAEQHRALVTKYEVVAGLLREVRNGYWHGIKPDLDDIEDALAALPEVPDAR